MSKTAAIIAIAVAAFIGGMSGYWLRGHALIAQQQASPSAFTTGPPDQVLTLAPPTGVVPGYPGPTSAPPPK